MRAVAVGFLVLLVQICSASSPQVISTSPDNKLAVQRRSLSRGDTGGEPQVVEIVDTKLRKVLYSWKSVWRSTVAMWSDDSHFLAVNDRIANSGDSLYIFAVDFDGERLKPLRLPDDDKLRTEVLRLHKNFGDLERCTIAATEWRGGCLWASVSGRWYLPGGDDMHVESFEFLWVFSFPHRSAPVLMQEWTQTYQYWRE